MSVVNSSYFELHVLPLWINICLAILEKVGFASLIKVRFKVSSGVLSKVISKYCRNIENYEEIIGRVN